MGVAFLAVPWGCAGQPTTRSPHVQGRLVSLQQRGQSPGRVRLTLHIREGWHIGAPDLRSGGLPTRIAWELPNGWSVAGEQWPQTERLPVAGDTISTLSGAVDIDAVLVHDAATTSGPITAVVTYGACKNICVPGKLTLALDALPTLTRESHDD